ncbi:hypothetical protein [Leifsonia xyli]|uniref:hypothetical protein n=1 Tax=Leifsonia xyli TaxID=1575 RepID=UPI003D679192
MATTLRRSVARAFGPFAITWWTWLVTLPFALTVMSGVQYVHGGPAEVLAVAGLQHAILGGLLLLGAGVLRRVGGHARPVAVIAVFALIGAARPVLFLEAGGLLGIPVVTGDLAGRMTINVVVVTVMFALVAAGVDLVHEHRGVFRRLRAAQSAADRDGDWASERLARLRNTAVDEVMTALEDAAETASAHRMDPAEAARLLRRLAEDVVRPASHRVYDDEVGAGTPEPEPPRFGEWPASLLAGMRAAPPVSTVLLFTGLVLPFALILVGPVSILPWRSA